MISAVAKYLNINSVGYALREETQALGIELDQVAQQGRGSDDSFYADGDLECWKDKSNDRQLKKNNGRSHTIKTCAFKAREFNHKYYSIQDNDECFTGNEDFSRHGFSKMCPWNGGEYIAHTFLNSSFFKEKEANDEEMENILRMAENDPFGKERTTNVRLKFSESYFYQNPFFARFLYSSLSKTKNDRLLRDTSMNENVFVHMRLGDVIEENMERPLGDWVTAVQRAIEKGGRNVFISSDTPNHERVRFICEKFNAQILEASPVETILFGSSCAYIVADGGTFSWIICAMAYRAKHIQYLLKTKDWHGDIFVFPEWERV